MNSYAAESIFAALKKGGLIFVSLWVVLSVALYTWKCSIVPRADRAGVVCAPYESVRRAFHQSWLAHNRRDWKLVITFDKWTGDATAQCVREARR